MEQKSTAEFFHELSSNLSEAFIKNAIDLICNRVRNTTIERLGYTAGDTGECIGVPAKRDRRSDGILEAG
jgi:hypothetical protein